MKERIIRFNWGTKRENLHFFTDRERKMAKNRGICTAHTCIPQYKEYPPRAWSETLIQCLLTYICYVSGVLTKVDLVDRGAEKTIVDMATNPVKYKIEKGFVLVKLRSQEDIDNQVTLQEAANNERRYFNEQAHYQ